MKKKELERAGGLELATQMGGWHAAADKVGVQVILDACRGCGVWSRPGVWVACMQASRLGWYSTRVVETTARQQG